MNEMLNSLYYRLTAEPSDLGAVLVELLLIGLCVNWAAGILQGTRGTRPLRGVLVILVVATLVVRILTVQFEWVRLNLLYTYVLYSLAFIALVVFQPELRRAIIRIGDVRFRRDRRPQSQVIAALVKSAGYLSRNRYGALIAMQRSVDLTGWAENGTMLRAEVSASLLNTVFYPGTPLHDLGVIIRGTRILAANCQFPSAESDEVDIALGSRHLAAVGMSYETDALVLVVSEETGVVSLADNGKLTRYLSLDELSDELAQRLAGHTAEEDGGRRRVSWWRRLRRLAAVVPLTLVIWYLADQATTIRDSVLAQLEIRLEDPNREAETAQPNSFQVEFSGPGRAVDRLRVRSRASGEQPLLLTWFPKGYHPQTEPYTIDAADEIRRIVQEALPRELRSLNVERVDLPALTFAVHELVTISLPVRVRAEARNVRIEATAEPATVDVRVRRADVKRVEQQSIFAPLGPQLEGVPPNETRQFSGVALRAPSGLSGPVQLSPPTVGVTAKIVAESRRVRDVNVELFVSPEVAEQYVVRKTDELEWKLEIEVQGDEAVIEPAQAPHIQAFVHVRNIASGNAQPREEETRTFDVIFLAPKGVSVVERRSVQVTLTPRGGLVP
ncbi:MAG: diadenylate cyclase [Planctomycetota bacterium]